ncbi:MAG: hypothetical protein AAGF92_06945 [Myxococcota bacterium]
MKCLSRLLPLLVMLALLGCGAHKAPTPDPALVIRPVDLYPFQEGNAWSYDVHTGDETTTLAVKKVDSVHGPIVTVSTGGAKVRYEVRDEGVYVPGEQAWLFKSPLEQGATWPARGGRTAEITSTIASIQTAAGSFQGCLEVRETGGRLGLEVRTIYCPFVGPVAVDSAMHSDVSDREASVSARLRGYTIEGSVITD